MTYRFPTAVAMVRPAAFQFNAATAATNSFQKNSALNKSELLSNALREFDGMVEKLRQSGIEVLVMLDSARPVLPDAVFPNNWFISLPGEILLCPMHTASRRGERKTELVGLLSKFTNALKISDWSGMELQNEFLEGTGSLILDRQFRKAFACLSPRTSEMLFKKFCDHTGYEGFLFEARGRDGLAIYHTNVMMCLANGFAVLCEEAIVKEQDRQKLRAILKQTGRSILPITFEQMENFSGNMLQLQNKMGEYILVMSSRAFESLLPLQIGEIKKNTRILSIDVANIERTGGGSVRCMMAELQTGET